MKKPLEERLWARADRASPDACWLWRGSTDAAGYGIITQRRPDKTFRAHRVSWEIANGRPPSGMICHKCDNPGCVNPDHLFEGSCADNIADMIAKGRSKGQRKTHCSQGHPYDEDNTYLRPPKGWRGCRACKRIKERARARAKRELVA